MRILVVDDEKDIQRLFQQRFRKEIKKNTIDFVFAFSGEEALKILDELDHKAVLILSDINMPGMSGLELLEKIKETYLNPTPTVMMITAYGDEHNRMTSKTLGADDFLAKPIDFKILKDKLKDLE
ncbi:MAG: response regulator [Bacteroidetes bacterium MedPE-SWsnd-G1]|nr:MAG: response regulator [Bacteroidetes bacterium MedPE-SWsnd-G1]